MRVLLDQNLPAKAAKVFAELGVEAEHVKTIGLAGRADGEVWRRAAETGAVIVTKDVDFTQIQDFVLKRPVRVVWVRIGNTSNQILIPWLRTHWPRAQALLDAGHQIIELR